MLPRHATLRRNLPVVWLHAPTASAWATPHTVKRHGSRIEDVVILEASGPAQ
jgi:hypothetical protein